MPLSAVIVDDEQLARDELAYLVQGIADVNVVAQGKNGLEAVNLIREHSPDLVFLDVQMPGLDGFGVIKKLLDRKVILPKFIFATAFDQYAVKAFEVNAVDYILKPFDKKRVAQSVEKARAKIEAGVGSDEKFEALVRMLESQKSQTAKILIKAAGRLFLADPKEICYATIDDGVITVVTGVSGSGKSTLVNDILYKALAKQLYRSREEPGAHKTIVGAENIDKVIRIDQSPIGRTPRSNPATYTGVFTHIRDLYAMLPESRERGYKPGRFSFNVKGGRCEACQGDGLRRIEMNFLPDVYVMCEVCRGRRYNSETLAVRFKGHSISDILNLQAVDALKLLENIPQIQQRLATIVEVGLGYVQLGQSATTLSGGEAQRIKLARELSKRQTGRTFYILDEPTTGLHFDDVRKLLDVLQRLVSLGNTVLIIEHNLDVIKQADWVIDLGPEGGEGGGRIVVQGLPETVVRTKKSYTGQALARVLSLHSGSNGSGK